MRTLQMSTHVKFRWNLITSCLDTVNKSLTEKWAGEKRKKETRAVPASVDTGTKITN